MPYQLKSGKWKSDLRIAGARHQKNWDTKSQKQAIAYEKAWIKELEEKANRLAQYGQGQGLDWLLNTESINADMRLSQAADWMYQRVWQHSQDAKNPPSRMRLVIKILGDIYISEVTDEKLLELKQIMLVKGFEGKRYADKTFNHVVSTLSSTIAMLTSARAITLNDRPTFKRLRAKERIGRIVSFTDEELEAMLKYFRNKAQTTRTLRDLEVLEFFIINSNLGLRPAEFYALQVGDVDLINETITVQRAYKTHTKKPTIGDTKNGLSRTLPIGGVALEALKGMIARARLARDTSLHEASTLARSISEGNEKDVYRWISEGYYEWQRGKPLESWQLTRLNNKQGETMWNQMRKELGLFKKEYTLYALRHTVASRLVSMRGFSAHRLMQFLGHTNIQTSLKYVHLNVDDIRGGFGVGIN